MAEAHPVGFQWVMEAKRRGAKVIHVDPRFTRTSAVSDLHVPIRAGSDIAFLGALVNHVLSNDLDFREYVVAYTNAAAIIDEELPGHRGPRRPVLRLRPRARPLRPRDVAVRRRGRPLRRPASATPRQAAGPKPDEGVGPDGSERRSPATAATGTRRRTRPRAPRRTAPAALRWPASPRGTRRCRTRAASSRSSSGTSPATPRRWCRRSAASPRSSSGRSPTR